jgi:leader peptidase (prepilin peptidase)/N-methyltransferase
VLVSLEQLPHALAIVVQVGVFALGAVVGSFLNVCIYRLPKAESIVAPRSYCYSCGTQLTFIDLIPILSFIFLGRRCRHCGKPFGWQYFIVELGTALLFLGTLRLFGVGLETLCVVTAGSALIVIFFIDLSHYIIPDGAVLILLVTGVIVDIYLLATDPNWGAVRLREVYAGRAWTVLLPRSLVGIVAGAGLFYGVAWLFDKVFGKESMGGGDIKLAGGVGAWLGPGYAFLAFFLLAVFVGALIGIVAWLMKRKKRREYIPFGPMLAVSALALILFRDQVTSFFLGFYTR